MSKQEGIFKIEEKANGDLHWNIIPTEILEESTLKNNEVEYDISVDLKIFIPIQLKITR